MKRLSTLAGLLISLLLPQLTYATTEQTMQVMLQGASAAELRQLVESSGGTVTHDLPIINAVGANLTQQQLDLALESPLIARHITDLSVSEKPEEEQEEPEKTCDVAGHLELNIEVARISWRLYNKKDKPAVLQKLTLEWPEAMGSIKSLTMAGTTLDPALYQSSTVGSLNLAWDKASGPSLQGNDELIAHFNAPASGQNSDLPKQRDFTIVADFGPDCSTKLIPGYDDNHNNFYYSSVAGADALHLNGVTGKGVTIAILDSGLWEHENLARDTAGNYRVLAKYDAITDTENKEVFDESGHGTHMTSVAMHSGEVTKDGVPQGFYKGIAPDAGLVAVKALDKHGHGQLLDLVRAIQWVVKNRQKYAIKVLNLSFAQHPRWPYWEDPVNQAAIHAWASGITVVTAAGNEGPDAMTIGSPGNLPYVITVGAVTDSWTPNTKGDDYIPDFSSRGPTPSAHIKPDVVAPGGHITGVIRPNSMLTQEHPEDILSTGEFVSTGSSQASALVTGIVALLLQLEPKLKPDDAKCKLLSSADPAINKSGLLSYSPFQQGEGYVNASRAVTLGQLGCGNPGMDIDADIANIEHYEGPAIINDQGEISLPGIENLVSTKQSAKGLSETRRWGVKAHIERQGPIQPAPAKKEPDINWLEIYLLEKAEIAATLQPTCPLASLDEIAPKTQKSPRDHLDLIFIQ